MGSFESSIGNKKFDSPAMRELDVPDASEFSDSQNQEAPAQRRRHNAQSFQAPQIDPAALREFDSRMYQDPSETEREIKQAKEHKRAGIEKLSPGAKKRVEMLIGMTRGTRVVPIDGNAFVLRTLKSGDMRSAFMAVSEFDGTVQGPFEMRRQFLARSLESIAGVDIEQFLGSYDLETKLVFLDELGEAILNRLYNEYLDLAKEYNERYAIKSAADSQEVLKDLKK